MKTLTLSILAALATPAIAAADTDHDIHFLSEHVPESAMDAHYQSLPWPAGRLERGEWQQSIDLSAASTHTDFIEIDGPMVAFAAATGLTHDSGYELLGFYSDMDVSGTGGRGTLNPSLDGVPLDLPAPADFTNPRGTFRHFGAGAAFVRERGAEGAARSSQLIAGLLLERAEVAGFEDDYRVAGGASVGTEGVLDHSSRATFLTPLVGWQQTRPISARWAWSPRAMLVFPLPAGDFDARLTGPGFDAAKRSGSAPEIGDPFVALGLAFSHLPSGLEVDLGGMLLFAAAERVSHDGVDQALTVHVAWRRRPRYAAD